MDPLDPQYAHRRTATATLDRWREVKPDKVFASMLRSADVSAGFRDVTMRDVANATDACAHWLEAHLGGRSATFETLAYVGLNDLRYAVFLYAAVKCGFKALFVSPRNPPAQNASLLQQTRCTRFFHAAESLPVVQAVQALMPDITLTEVAPLDHWISAFTHPYPNAKTYDEAKNDPILVLHSSGSTGAPKPITMTHAYFAASNFPVRDIPGRRPTGKAAFNFPGGGFFFCPFPFYHLAGLTAVCMYPVTTAESSAVIALPDRPPTPLLIQQIIDAKRLRALYSPPSLIEAIIQLPRGLDSLSSLELISYAGGPLALAAGNALVDRAVTLTTTYGSTETGANHMLIPAATRNWNYYEFHPDFGARMEPALDGAFELVFRRTDPFPDSRGISFTFPHADEYRTRDMFKPHPTEEGLWTFYARNDDIIVLANGAKYNPVPAEGAILGSPLLSGVLILGDGREQVAALLEPNETPASDEALIEQVWPDIVRANEQSQRQGQVARHMVVVVEPKSVVRAPKGTIVRTTTVDKFRDVIEALYAGRTHVDRAQEQVALGRVEDAVALVRDCTTGIPHLNGISDHEDFYGRGLDSVQTVELTRSIKSRVKAQHGDLAWLIGQTLFEHPTINSLGHALWQGLQGSATSHTDATSSIEAMDSMVAKYTAQIRAQPPADHASAEPSPQNPKHCTVLLTGSTGFLGQRILHALLRSPDVAHIHCLDRSSGARERVTSVLRQRTDLAHAAESKLTFHTAQLGSAHLGLAQDTYASLARDVDAVIHNAWKIDFNHSLASFEPVHVQGVANLVAFAQQCAHSAHLTFISSVSAVANWHAVHGGATSIPEAVVEDGRVAQNMGYAQSKQVAERIVATSASCQRSILRVGQIAGAATPADVGPHWNSAEWVPAMLRSSRALQCLPAWLPDVDWIPVDVLGDAVAQIALRQTQNADGGQSAQVYNLVNPRKTRWSELVKGVLARYSACTAVPYATWLAKLRELDAEDAAVLERVPALKIRAFFESLERGGASLVFDTERAVEASEALRAVPAVREEWLDAWMARWEEMWGS